MNGFQVGPYQTDFQQSIGIGIVAQPIGIGLHAPVDFLIQGPGIYGMRPMTRVVNLPAKKIVKHDDLQEMVEMYKKWKAA